MTIGQTRESRKDLIHCARAFIPKCVYVTVNLYNQVICILLPDVFS